MKKILSFILCAVLLLSLAACGEPKDENDTPPSEVDVSINPEGGNVVNLGGEAPDGYITEEEFKDFAVKAKAYWHDISNLFATEDVEFETSKYGDANDGAYYELPAYTKSGAKVVKLTKIRVDEDHSVLVDIDSGELFVDENVFKNYLSDKFKEAIDAEGFFECASANIEKNGLDYLAVSTDIDLSKKDLKGLTDIYKEIAKISNTDESAFQISLLNLKWTAKDTETAEEQFENLKEKYYPYINIGDVKWNEKITEKYTAEDWASQLT